jgi:hypothetical protein
LFLGGVTVEKRYSDEQRCCLSVLSFQSYDIMDEVHGAASAVDARFAATPFAHLCIPGAISIIAADVDGDGGLDLIAAAYHTDYSAGNLVWCEPSRPGDANDDGHFDSADLVFVFQKGPK